MSFTIETEQNNKYHSYMSMLIANKVNLQQLSLENELLVVYTAI